MVLEVVLAVVFFLVVVVATFLAVFFVASAVDEPDDAQLEKAMNPIRINPVFVK